MPFGSTIVEVLLAIIVVLFSLFYFVNSLYYSLSLLGLVVLLLVYLTSQTILSSLSMIMLCIVYIGAMIILIGYICAICPNVIVQSSFSTPTFGLLAGFFFFFYYFSKPFSNFSFIYSVSLVDYFYSSYGFFIFILIVFMLFVTLLIVTSQYLTPKGPFRSVS